MAGHKTESLCTLQVGDQAWKFGRHWVKAGGIGDPTRRNVEPCSVERFTVTAEGRGFDYRDCINTWKS